ncbi:YceD family protein [Trueperella sp. LYQ143]|uniref:YceD family protein n=1 Tax=unclassified Trueperella TaxID=2630174 RepID=UPI003983BC80
MITPFVVSSARLARLSREDLIVDEDIPAPESFGIDVLTVAPDEPIGVNVRISATSDGILVNGRTWACATGECARCLRPVNIELDRPIMEMVFSQDRREELIAQGDEEAQDFFVLTDEGLDLEPLIRDALILAMPLTPLCDPECQGLCQGCYERLDDLPADHHHDYRNPDFAALDDLARLLGEENPDA